MCYRVRMDIVGKKTGGMMFVPYKDNKEGAEYLKKKMEERFAENIRRGEMKFEVVEVSK